MDFQNPGPNAFAQMVQMASQGNPQQSGISQEEMELAAQQRGYDSYEQMIAYQQRRIPPPRRPREQVQPQGENVFQRLMNDPMKTISDAFDWHPSRTLNRADRALQSANRRNQE